MGKPNLTQTEDENTEVPSGYETQSTWRRAPLWLRAFSTIMLASILLVASFEVVYAGRIFPGVTADGIDLAGTSRSSAIKQLVSKTHDFNGQVVTISYGDTNLRIPVAALSVTYDTAHAADVAYRYGRQGSWQDRARQQLRALAGRTTNISAYNYSDERLVPYVVQLSDDIITPVANASLRFNSDKPQVTPAQTGTRLDYGRLIQMVADRLSQTSAEPVKAPVYQLAPTLDTAALQNVTNQLGSFLAGPITLKYMGTVATVNQQTIISWVEVGARPSPLFLNSHSLTDLYPPASSANIGLSKPAVAKYVANMASDIDQTAQNAGLAMQDGALAIVKPSRSGIKLDQIDAVDAIIAGLKRTGDDRQVNLKLQITQADVNESNLDSLGIKEQISEGETFFPGSPSTRLTNVRAGASKFNGVLLKPGETFSFGKLLGAVDASTGYVPELVILGDHEEKQYGGGLCQVSSTAFRAALAAGLPITERVNHSFAISYYTWPYAAPGVDATIYYPSVDFKFVNDTEHYILMQTVMSGVDLKFAYFGTKNKTGILRPPTFVSGTNDPTVPSHTVFYRDVTDLSGKIIKTDTFNTYYKSSKDFPITKQFN